MAVEWNGVQVFSATMQRDRDILGERVTQWLRDHPHCKPVDIVTTQSSDEAFHCISICVFYFETPRRR